MSVRGCGMSHDRWLCMVCDSHIGSGSPYSYQKSISISKWNSKSQTHLLWWLTQRRFDCLFGLGLGWWPKFLEVSLWVCSHHMWCCCCLVSKEAANFSTVKYCHEPCTATMHGHPTLLRTDLFETVIECTATDHVIFSRCIYISFHGNLFPLAWIWVVIPHSLIRASLDTGDWGDSL